MPGMRRSRRRYYSREDATPLITAVVMMKEEPQKGWARLQKAIQSHPDMDEHDTDGFTALMYAVRLNLPEIIPALLEAGATVDLKDEDGNTPFFYACMFRHWEVMDILFTLGADPEVHDENGLTALLTAIDDQEEELVEKLLKLGASPNTCSATGVPPLFMALSHKHRKYDVAILRRLLVAGADVNMANADGITPLMVACHRRYTEGVKMLIHRGASVNATDVRGRAAIHFCLRTVHNFPCLRLLLKSGACTNVVDKRGATPLSLLGQNIEKSLKTDTAHENLYLKILSELMSYGADPNIVTSRTSPTYLMSTVTSLESSDVAARTLLAAGAEPLSSEPYVKDANSELVTPPSASPLTLALDTGKMAAARLMVEGLFYTQYDLMYLSTHCPSTHSTTNDDSFTAVRNNLLATDSDSSLAFRLRTVSYVLAQNSSLVSPTQRVASDPPSVNVPTTDNSSGASGVNVNPLHNGTVSASSAGSPRMNHLEIDPQPTNIANRPATTSGNSNGTADLNRNVHQLIQISSDQSQLTQNRNTDDLSQNVTSRVRNAVHRSLSRPSPMSSEHWSQISEMATQVCQTPPSLQQLCRRSIHRAIGCRNDRAACVKQLPIWAKLQRYILFQTSEYQQ